MKKKFLVINCLNQGFAVAGPNTTGGRLAEVDLEMIAWGLDLDKAETMAADLNADAKIEHIKD